MDVLIYGAGTYCQELLRNIVKYENINIIGIADSYVQGSKYGYKIYDLLGSEERILEDAEIVIAIRPYIAFEVAKKLKEKGYKKIWLYLNKDKTHASDFLTGECISLNGIDDLTLLSIEMQTVDYCNLNCKGCSHFSPIFEKKAPDFNARIQDLYLLRKLFHKIIFISLLGGEPLLSPDMDKYVTEARRLFPDSEIQIVTNGLLLCEGSGIGDDLLKLIAENNITVSISEYKPTHAVIQKIISRLEKFKVDYIIRPYDSKEKFNIAISVSNNSKYNLKCREEGCVAVCEGKIAKCPTLLYLHKFNERFEQALPQDGILELKDYKDGKRLIIDLNRKVPLCDYCIDCEIDWSICNKDMTIDDFAKLD